MPCKFFSYNIYIYTKYIIYIYYTLKSAKNIDTDIAIGNDKTSYVSELTTTHLVKQDDVGMTVARIIDTALTQSGVRGESPIEPDGTSMTS